MPRGYLILGIFYTDCENFKLPFSRLSDALFTGKEDYIIVSPYIFLFY